MPTPPKITPADIKYGFVYTSGGRGGGSVRAAAPGGAVAHIVEMRDLSPHKADPVPHRGPFPVMNPNVTGAVEKPVPAVVIHAKHKHDMFSVPHNGMPLSIGDVITTSPTTVLAIHFVLGGEVGVDRGSTVQVVSERSISPLPSAAMKMLAKGRIWSNISHESSQKMLIQTNGGVMGIKG